MDYGCEMQLLQDGAQLQLQLQPEEFVAIADYTATDETQVSVITHLIVPHESQRASWQNSHSTIKQDLCLTVHLTNHTSGIQRPAGWWGSISLLGELGVEPPVTTGQRGCQTTVCSSLW